MTGTTISEEEFALFVREHRGDYVYRPECASAVVEFVESIRRDREELRRILARQVPPYDLVSGRVVPALDGTLMLPDGKQVAQVVPAGGWWRIGHVVSGGAGWTAFHYLAPYEVLTIGASQLEAVITVFAEHFATMRWPVGE